MPLKGYDIEKQEEDATPSRSEIGVMSIEQAEAEFAELQRSFSDLGRAIRMKSKQEEADVETSISEDASFDLETCLRDGQATEQEAGIRPKHIGVYWDRLTVKGIRGGENYVKTFPNAVIDFFDYVTPLLRLLGMGKQKIEATLLDSFRGVCRPGEMILVLGKPGSGCTTFLKSIANQRYGFTNVEGEVLYGPFTAKEFERYRGEAVYNQEDDVHHATLTVEQTLGFALDTKIAGKLLATKGTQKKLIRKELLNMLLKMFNIEHTRHTVVGGHLVRGISGGEKKRLSVAEMLCTNASILSWDNSTKGLDASTALDFVKALRVYANLYKTTTFVSLYQASENIYNLFDRVMVLDSGKQVYLGPAKEARSYFESLGFAPRARDNNLRLSHSMHGRI